MTPHEVLEKLKQAAVLKGYRIESSPDGNEQRLIRPDGSVAVIAKKKGRPNAQD